MSDYEKVYVVYKPFCHTHMTAHVTGVYATEEGASYAAHRLLLDKNAQQFERVIIQLQHITDTAYSLAQLKGRQKAYQKEQGIDDYLVNGDFEEEKRKSESSTTLGEDS